MSSAPASVADRIAAQLPRWCDAFGVPGGGLVVWQAGQRSAAFCGIADVRSGEPVQGSTRFPLGSIVKLYVASMAMQAVQAGRLHLDRPLQDDWPELPLPGPWAERITLRHLLTHRGGFEGDVFDDMGNGDDALRRFAQHGRSLPAPFQPGDLYSYSNCGYALLGRVLELVHGSDWDAALQRTLLQPLGLQDTGTPFAPPVRSGPMAFGHSGAAGAWQASGESKLLRSNGPAGSTAFATVDDLARFGLAHLDLSRAAPGNEWLSRDLHARMSRREVTVPCPNGWTGFGLGVMHFDDAGALLGHNGAIDGVWTFLRWVPQADLVLALMVNGGDANGLMAALSAAAFPALAAVRPALPPQEPQGPPSERLDDFVGRYGSNRYHVDVVLAGGGHALNATFVPGPLARDFGAPFSVLLRPDPAAPGSGRCIGRMPGSSVASYQGFLPHGGQAAGVLNFRGRSLPRLPGADESKALA